ncbi:MAG: DNA alkylation repair protein [Candidatus Thermoplasmatota archaeon]
MTLNVAAERKMLVAEVRRHGKKGGDAWLQHYVGSPYPVLGLSSPQMGAIQTAFAKAHPDLTAKDVNALAAAVRRGPTTEEKWLAVGLMDRHAKILDEASWRLLNRFVDDSVGWGLCDGLGSGPVSKMVHAKPARFRELVKWSKSPNPWRRRVALYALHDFVRAKEFDKPSMLLERLLYDEEFWVQRAVGTWLRECWKVDRKRTEAFLQKHVRGLPKVVITVATERAPKAFREELRRAR